MIKGEKIKWIRYVGPEGPKPGEVGTVTEAHANSPLFLVEWPDEQVTVESIDDSDDYWTLEI